MEYRLLGGSGFKVPVLGFGTVTFGNTSTWGTASAKDAKRFIDVCIEAGANFFDTSNFYSGGNAEAALGHALAGRRNESILLTKVGSRVGPGPNDTGASRHHIIKACEDSLRRLGTDYIDIYMIHEFDALTPIEESLRAFDDLVRAGKVRYVGCSNFSGWQVMKALAISEKYGLPRMVVHQVHYSLLTRDYELELMPLGIDQGVGAMVWSPLAWGRLSGKYKRGQPPPPDSRMARVGHRAPPQPDEDLYGIMDVVQELSEETGKTNAQVALNWILRRPTVAAISMGASSEAQLRDNFGAVGWALTPEQVARLDAVTKVPRVVPYDHQRIPHNMERHPTAV